MENLSQCYIYNNHRYQRENKCVSLSTNGIRFEQFKTIFKQVYNRDYIPNIISIQNSANVFRGQYHDVNDVDEFSFTHHGIKQASINSILL
jgi:hypothetical protein